MSAGFQVCVNCGALKADHIRYPGRPLLCPTTAGTSWAPKGRHCAYCGKPGGPSHAIQVGGQMRSFYVHRQCVRKLIAKIGDE